MPTLFEDAVELIRTRARELGPSFGWEFLYCPSSLLSKRSHLWFIGINPGGMSDKAVPCFERGNAYSVDQPLWSPHGEVLRNQVKEFFDQVACAVDGRSSGKALLDETLTANFCPFNSETWLTFPKAERQKAVKLSRELWGAFSGSSAPG